MEMRIPFSSLKFQDNEGRVIMGIIAWRTIPRKNEKITFPAIPPKWGWSSSWKPSQAQEVVLEGIYSRKPLHITPYLSGGLGQSSESNQANTTYTKVKVVCHFKKYKKSK